MILRFTFKGMSRGGEGRSDQLCAKCNKTISDWNADLSNNQNLKRDGWCSWCFENTTHTLDQKKKVTRSEFKCDGCSLKTLGCLKCEDGMAR